MQSLQPEADSRLYLCIDNFNSQFFQLRQWAIYHAAYGDIENPVDGAVYPDIALGVPQKFVPEIGEKLATFMGREITFHSMFLRRSLEGVPVPHQAHTDASMGAFSAMLYMTLDKDTHPDAGTQFLKHRETGMDTNPEDEAGVEAWQRDMNTPEAWDVVETCAMKQNRCCIFDSSLFHRAAPIGGFGQETRDARLVLTVFFS